MPTRDAGEGTGRHPAPVLAGAIAVAAGAIAVAAGAFALGASLPAGPALTWGLIGAAVASLATIVVWRATSARRTAADVAAAAFEDPLTGLPNRAGFEQRAAAELSRARRRGERFSVLYFDLDEFARVHEELGAAEGDQLLRTVAFETLAVLRGEDLMARLDSDDFALLLPGIDSEGAHRVVARVVTAVERAVPGAGALARVTASVGTSCYPADGENVADLVEAARVCQLGVKVERETDGHRLDSPLVPAEGMADCLQASPADAAEATWRPRPAAGAASAFAVITLAAWFALAGPVAAGSVRAGVTAAAVVFAILACAAAARRAGGRERTGWTLLGIGVAVWFVPLWGPVAGLLSAVGLLLVIDDRWLRDRLRLLDVAGVCLSVVAVAAALTVPPLLDAGGGTLLIASHISSSLLGIALVSAAYLAVYWAPMRRRPDVTLVAVGFVLAVAATAPWTLALEQTVFVPSTAFEVGVVFGLLAIGAGGLLRNGHRSPLLSGAGLEERTLDGMVVGDLLLASIVAAVSLSGEPVAAAIMVPLLVCVLLLRDLRSRFLERDRRRLRQTVIRGRRELAQQWQSNLAALGNALEARDGYTGEHSEATTLLTKRVATRLGLSRAARAEVEAVAMLHDVGKIGVPDDVLRKPSALSDDEWALMREHPVIGERILAAVPGLEKIARAVRHEHERWDGAGYPDGLAGQAIPLASRIVLACDTWQAMVTDRPYRSSRPREEALVELRAAAGVQLDPAVVHALLDELRSDAASSLRRPRPRRRRMARSR